MIKLDEDYVNIDQIIYITGETTALCAIVTTHKTYYSTIEHASSIVSRIKAARQLRNNPFDGS